MGSLKKSVVLNYFGSKFNSGIQVNEHGKIIEVIRVAELDSRDLFEEIASFTKQLKNFKMNYR